MIASLIASLVFAMSHPTKGGDNAPLKKADAVQVVPVAPTPEADSAKLVLVIPKPEQSFQSTPIYVQFRLYGFALGAGSSQFERSTEIANAKIGQSVHVIVDDHPPFPITEPAIDPFDESSSYYNTSYKFQIPFSLSRGEHLIQLFATRSFGESLKNPTCYQAAVFFVGSEGKKTIDLQEPYLTLNEPGGDSLTLKEGEPILLDFLVHHCELSSDGYKVRLILDGKARRTFTSYQPYYIYGLKKGKHSLRLELLDPKGKKIASPFSAERTFQVHS